MNWDKLSALGTLAAAVFAGITLLLQIQDSKRDPTVALVVLSAVLVLFSVSECIVTTANS